VKDAAINIPVKNAKSPYVRIAEKPAVKKLNHHLRSVNLAKRIAITKKRGNVFL
jgi:hypothetical protein